MILYKKDDDKNTVNDRLTNLTTGEIINKETFPYNRYTSSFGQLYHPLTKQGEKFLTDSIPLYTKSGAPRCAGSALDQCTYNWRGVIARSNYKSNIIGDDPNSLDAWDIRPAIESNNIGEVIYDAAKDGPVSDELLQNLPLNALLGWGDARGHYGISEENPKPLAKHLTSVAQFANNLPVQWDWGEFGYTTNSSLPKTKYDLDDLQYILVPKKIRYYKEAIDDIKPEKPLNVDTYIKKLKTTGLEVTDRFTRDLTKFDAELVKSKPRLMTVLNLTEKGYDLLRQEAIAIATQETATIGDAGRFLDDLGGASTGLTQILSDNVDVLKERYPGLIPQHMSPRSIKVAATLTMALLAENAKRTDKMKAIKKGSGKITEYNNVMGNYLSFLYGIEKNKARALSKKLLNHTPKFLIPKVYITTRATTGNKDLDTPETHFYMWNNPARITTGDAGGRTTNKYVKNTYNYYDMLTPLLK